MTLAVSTLQGWIRTKKSGLNAATCLAEEKKVAAARGLSAQCSAATEFSASLLGSLLAQPERDCCECLWHYVHDGSLGDLGKKTLQEMISKK